MEVPRTEKPDPVNRYIIINQSATIDAGTWNPEDQFVANEGYQNKEVKRFFRIGIVLGLPWAWINASDHPTDVNFLKEDLPNRGLTGYCVDLLEKLSDKDHMDFDYEIVPATKVITHNEKNAVIMTNNWSRPVQCHAKVHLFFNSDWLYR